nr:uncharacterized protein LOC106678687 [Halyomorpha halys]
MVRHCIINYNITGLMKRKLELETLLASRRPSIVALTDTRLSNYTQTYFRGYTTYRLDSPIHGGVALLVRHDVPSRLINGSTLHDNKHTAITIQVRLEHSYKITCVYRSPSAKPDTLKTFLCDIENDRQHIILGDLNAKHHSWNCAKGNALGNYLTKTKYTIIHPDAHTYRQTSNPSYTSTLDLLLTQQPHRFTNCNTLEFSDNDHLPVLYQLGKHTTPTPPTDIKYNFRQADWKLYKRHVYDNIPNITTLSSPQDISTAIGILQQTIRDAANTSIPTFTPTPIHLRTPPQHILTLIKQRNNIKNCWYRTKDQTYRPIINSLTRQITSLMSQWKTSLWHEQLRRTHYDPKNFWKLIRSHNTKSKSVKLHRGDELLTPADQADVLSDYYLQRDNARTVTCIPPPTPDRKHTKHHFLNI